MQVYSWLGLVIVSNDRWTNKSLIIKYGMYANIFAEKMWVAFANAKATHIFYIKISVNLVLYLLEQ